MEKPHKEPSTPRNTQESISLLRRIAGAGAAAIALGAVGNVNAQQWYPDEQAEYQFDNPTTYDYSSGLAKSPAYSWDSSDAPTYGRTDTSYSYEAGSGMEQLKYSEQEATLANQLESSLNRDFAEQISKYGKGSVYIAFGQHGDNRLIKIILGSSIKGSDGVEVLTPNEIITVTVGLSAFNVYALKPLLDGVLAQSFKSPMTSSRKGK